MPTLWTARLCCFLLVVTGLATPAWAYKREVRLPLHGCGGNITAVGSARYSIKRNEPDVPYHEALTIEVRNVALTPGTVLVIYAGDEFVGNVTIDAKQSGSLTVTNENRRYVPSLNWGTSIMIKKLDGSLVIW